MVKIVAVAGNRGKGKTYEIIMTHIIELKLDIKDMMKRLDKLEKQIKDIDMDMNDVFDEVVGTDNENNNK